MITAGIDVGSITTKAVLMAAGEIVAEQIAPTGFNARQTAGRIFETLVSDGPCRVADVDAIVATGYGRNSVAFAVKAITEITCHARGARFLNPAVRTVIDIGGQDSKALVMDAAGEVKDFVMNDKCAAGTGRFLDVMSRALEIRLEDFGAISRRASRPARISSICTVFAESEIISLVARGERRPNIVAGIHESIAARVAAMTARIGFVPPVMMTGGVARNSGVVTALEKTVESAVEVSPKAQLTGAIGAALMAARMI